MREDFKYERIKTVNKMKEESVELSEQRTKVTSLQS